MLLTSGQISMGISSCVVFVFTSILFLSGYVLQQQSVRSLEAVLIPKQQQPWPIEVDSEARVAVPFGDPPWTDEKTSSGDENLSNDWSNNAYAQQHAKACDVVVAITEPEQQKTLAQRALRFPWTWWQGKQNTGALVYC